MKPTVEIAEEFKNSVFQDSKVPVLHDEFRNLILRFCPSMYLPRCSCPVKFQGRHIPLHSFWLLANGFVFSNDSLPGESSDKADLLSR